MKISRKKLNQKGLAPLLIVLIVVAALAVGGAGYYVYKKQQDKKNTQSVTGGQDLQASNGGPDFNPQFGENDPFIATITGTVNGEESTIKLASDGKGTTEFTMTSEGQEIRYIYTADSYYMCTGGQCTVMKLDGASQATLNSDDYTYSQEEIANFKSTSTYLGQQSCPSGTCNVWQVNDGVEGSTNKLFVDTGSNRITQIEMTTNEGTSTIAFEYKDVTINIPANAQELVTP